MDMKQVSAAEMYRQEHGVRKKKITLGDAPMLIREIPDYMLVELSEVFDKQLQLKTGDTASFSVSDLLTMRDKLLPECIISPEVTLEKDDDPDKLCVKEIRLVHIKDLIMEIFMLSGLITDADLEKIREDIGESTVAEGGDQEASTVSFRPK